MISQKVHFSIKSSVRCKHCGDYLKLNIVNRKPTADQCWKCSKIERRRKEQDNYKRYKQSRKS